MLKVNKNYVYREIKRGEIKSVHIGSIKVRREDLEAYVESKGVHNATSV